MMKTLLCAIWLFILASPSLASDRLICIGTHGYIMGTGDNGQFFEGNLEAGGIEISIEPDDSLIVFDSNDVEKVRVSTSSWTIPGFSRWSFAQHGLFSLRQEPNNSNTRDAIFLSFFSNGQIGMVKRYSCY